MYPRRFCAWTIVCHCLLFSVSCSDSSTDEPKPTSPPVPVTAGTTPQSSSADADSNSTSGTKNTPSEEVVQSDFFSKKPEKAEESTPEEKTPEPQDGNSRKEMLKKTSSGVVVVNAYDARGELEGFGSGCILSDTLILTNYHVIDSAASIKIVLQAMDSDNDTTDESSEGLKVIGYTQLDEENDLALIAVEEIPNDLHRFTLADAQSVEQFDEVFAIGHPDGLKFSTTRGFVNALVSVDQMPAQIKAWLPGTETRYIQTDAVISGGSSGGPLLNLNGEIVGINTLLFEETRFGFAVASNHIRDLYEQPAVSAHPLPVPGADVIVTEAVADLKYDFDREWLQLRQDLQQAQARGEDRDALMKLMRTNNPAPVCVKRCLEFVNDQPESPEAIDGLKASADILSQAGERMGEDARYYLDQTLTDIVSSSQLIVANRRLMESFIGLGHSMPLEEYLRAVMNQSTDKQVQASAGIALVTAFSTEGATDFQADLKETASLLIRDYGEIKVQGRRVEEYLEPILSQSSIAIGSLAQEIVGKDLEGVEFKLSDYRGKVVVLDFWADWCPHCRIMYEHERKLVERLKDQPFALLGVNTDEPERADRIMNSGQITWRCWMDGRGGPITQQWKISAYPTIYVLDQEGRIRFEGVRGEAMDAAVESLLHGSQLQLPEDLIASDAVWNYSVVSDATDYAGWKLPEFDDGQWLTGKGSIGFGREDLNTIVDVGEPGARSHTILLRHNFEHSAPIPEKPVYLNLRYNDGVAVYLNGEEIYRSNLSQQADLTNPATVRATSRETDDGVCLAIEGKLLQAGSNCVAVELHQVSSYNADGLYALTLGSELPAIKSSAKSTETDRLKVCQMLAQLDTNIDTVRESLEAFQKDDSSSVRMVAIIAAAMNGTVPKSKESDNPQYQQYVWQMIQYLNAQAWEIVRNPDLSEHQYRTALKNARAAIALKESLPKELQSSVKGVLNTLGVALYRIGDDENAILKLEESLKQDKENPVDIAYLSLAHRRLNHTEQAEKHKQRLAALLEEPGWKNSSSAIEALKEVNQKSGEDTN